MNSEVWRLDGQFTPGKYGTDRGRDSHQPPLCSFETTAFTRGLCLSERKAAGKRN